MVEAILGEFRSANGGAVIGRGRADLECGLCRFGKAAPAQRRAGNARIARPRRRTPPVPRPAAAARGIGKRARRAKRGDRRASSGRRRTRTVPRKRLLERVHDQRAHESGIAKAHFGLGRMHVDIDLTRRNRDEQREQRMPVARQVVGIGCAHRAKQKLVAHRPLVDEQILAERIGARQRRQRGKPFDHDALAFTGDGDGIGAEIGPKHVAEPGEPAGAAGKRRGKSDRRALLAGEREGDVGPAHGEPPHGVAHGLGLGAVELEEFQSRGCRVEQVAHLNPRTLTERGGLELRFGAGIDLDRPGVRLAFVARRDRKPRHSADRGQCLAAEAERRDGDKILVGKLRGGVPLNGEREVVTRHALAVVADADEPAAAAVGEDVDAARAGIECVLDEFLDHARRTLDHLAGGDAVDHCFGELANGHGDSLDATKSSGASGVAGGQSARSMPS
jgi:hypothetical protein